MRQRCKTLSPRDETVEYKQGACLSTQKLDAGALAKAAVEGDADYLELLILNGMQPNQTDYNERTPLHLAASHGHVHIVRYLCHLPVSRQISV